MWFLHHIGDFGRHPQFALETHIGGILAPVASLGVEICPVLDAFRELTLHLNSEINTLGYSRAALFGFCVALVTYIITWLLIPWKEFLDHSLKKIS
jgi:hypothetical protein